jgi:peptidoglycan L-alanyl-D-glutamate endopeptidase CwlK
MTYSLSKKSIDNLAGVHPDLVKVVRRAIQLTPVDFRVNEGLRTLARQKQLVAAGASRTMKSRHITGHAVDLVAVMDLDHDGTVETQEMFHWPLYPKIAEAMKQAASELGVKIEWGGAWRTFKDGPHFQLPFKEYPA